MQIVDIVEMVSRYCSRQDAKPSDILSVLSDRESRMDIHGWMLLECVMLDSSRCGEFTMLPFGPGCTFKTPPDRPISPRGLASDMSTVVAVCYLERKES